MVLGGIAELAEALYAGEVSRKRALRHASRQQIRSDNTCQRFNTTAPRCTGKLTVQDRCWYLEPDWAELEHGGIKTFPHYPNTLPCLRMTSAEQDVPLTYQSNQSN